MSNQAPPTPVTFYGATGVGNCLYDATTDIGIAALNHADYGNARMCGAYLQVKGPGARSPWRSSTAAPNATRGHRPQ